MDSGSTNRIGEPGQYSSFDPCKRGEPGIWNLKNFIRPSQGTFDPVKGSKESTFAQVKGANVDIV